MNDIAIIDIERLQSFFSDSDAGKALFEWFLRRQMGSVEMPVRVAAKNTGISYEAMRQVLVALQEMGLGCLVKGTRGHETRMVWSKDIRDIAAVAKGDQVTFSAPNKQGPKLEDEEISADNAEYGFRGDLLPHNYWLRPGLEISLHLPSNLTRHEAARLAAFIKTLPLDQSCPMGDTSGD